MTVLKIQQLDTGFMAYLNKNGKAVKSVVLTIEDLHKIVDEAFTPKEKKDGP